MGPSAIFDRMKDEEFIKEEILPNFTDCFLKNERYVLLLSQFITMKDRLSFAWPLNFFRLEFSFVR